MELIDERIQSYCEAHSSIEPGLLQRINRDTHAHVRDPRMLSGHLQGRLLSMISMLLRPVRILEIGTYTGYSAICMAEGLQPGGQLITIDNNEEMESRVRQNFSDAGMDGQIDYVIGEAAEVIPRLEGRFDLVFIDADKENYAVYYKLVMERLNLGGVILVDNVLWSGKVLDKNPDTTTKAILGFNEMVLKDTRVRHVLLPIRDGIMWVRKTST